MRQVFLSGGGEVRVFDVPIPGRLPGSVLVRNAFSLISAGTEGAAVTSRSGLLGAYEKARASSDRMQQVWQMALDNGFVETYAQVRRRLADFSPIGYSCAGQVVETDGEGMPFQPGDLVACMGAGLASHAEYVVVPRNLVTRVPSHVPLEQASFGALACIALQGIRRLELTPGERVGVLGLGLIGQLCLRLLGALGYQPFGFDLDPRKVETAANCPGAVVWSAGEADAMARIMDLTNGEGLDGLVICAATESSEPVNEAFTMLRSRGRVSIVGDVGLGLDRSKMYRKELELRLSCSYGPGRYDDRYEMDGIDYPQGFVRWTEGRNVELFVQLLGSGKLDLAELVTGTYPIDEAPSAYRYLKSGGVRYGLLLDYALPASGSTAPEREARTVRLPTPAVIQHGNRVRIGLIGLGGYAKGVHVPNLQALSELYSIRAVASRTGAAAPNAKALGAAYASSDYRVLLDDPEIEAVLIATRHASHARMIQEALDAGKHIFVEKPMTVTVEDGKAVLDKCIETGLTLRVGFNRRFSPHLRLMRDTIGVGRCIFTVRVNVGAVGSHWSNTDEEGGRLLGEGVHFFDLCNWFMGAEPVAVSAEVIGEPVQTNPNACVSISYPDGSVGQVVYTTLGDPRLGKEYIEAFGGGRSTRCDDYISTEVFPGSARLGRRARNDKGQREALREFALALQGETHPVRGADARAGLLATWIARSVFESARMRAAVTCDI